MRIDWTSSSQSGLAGLFRAVWSCLDHGLSGKLAGSREEDGPRKVRFARSFKQGDGPGLDYRHLQASTDYI